MKTLMKISIIFSILLSACSQIQHPLNENIVRPVLKEKPKLIYPSSEQENNHWGTVHVLFTISEKGNVTEVLVKESSGFIALDKAAENYCKGLVFIPATMNGMPIEFGMKLEIKFNLKDLKDEIKNRIRYTNSLYNRIEYSEGREISLIQKEILDNHKYIIDRVSDRRKFNDYVYGVISPDIKNEWEPTAKSCPLSFLLYYDFITRFADYPGIDSVKSLLEYSIKQDLYYLSVVESEEINNNRISLINKIRRFVENKYPHFKLDYPNVEIRHLDKDIS